MLRQLIFCCLLLPLQGYFTTNEKARHIISNVLEDQTWKNRTKRGVRLKSQHPIVPPFWGHSPASPQFPWLMKQMRSLVPGELVEKDSAFTGKKAQKVLRKMMVDLRRDYSKDERLMRRLEEMESLLRTPFSSGSVIMDKLNELFSYLENVQQHYGNLKMKDDDPWSKAPFTSLGQDCFADVDHKELSWEIRRTALTMAKYIEDRMAGQNNVQFKVDTILTQVIVLLAELHRATLRNWHQTLMLIGNFAYTQEEGIDDLLHEKFNSET